MNPGQWCFVEGYGSTRGKPRQCEDEFARLLRVLQDDLKNCVCICACGFQVLRSRPPFTGVLRGPGLKVPHGVLFGQFWAPASECPKECFLSAFGRFLGLKMPKLQGSCPKLSKKHSVGHFQARAPEHSCKWHGDRNSSGRILLKTLQKPKTLSCKGSSHDTAGGTAGGLPLAACLLFKEGQSPRQSPSSSPGTTPGAPPSTPIFPGSLRSSFGELGFGGPSRNILKIQVKHL